MKSKVFVIIFIGFSISLFPWIAFNQSDCYFSGGCEDNNADTSSSKNCSNIRWLIAESGTAFYKSNSITNDLLSKIEASSIYGLDSQSMLYAVNQSIDRMEWANDYYSRLMNLAAETPYNHENVQKLKDFDYKKYQRENNLNSLFEKVKYYLSAGDIHGIYQQMNRNCFEILLMLYELREMIEAGENLENSKTWVLNERIMESTFFAQYAARVFVMANSERN